MYVHNAALPPVRVALGWGQFTEVCVAGNSVFTSLTQELAEDSLRILGEWLLIRQEPLPSSWDSFGSHCLPHNRAVVDFMGI